MITDKDPGVSVGEPQISLGLEFISGGQNSDLIARVLIPEKKTGGCLSLPKDNRLGFAKAGWRNASLEKRVPEYAAVT